MQTKFKIIETPDYTLAVSDEVRVDSITDWYYEHDNIIPLYQFTKEALPEEYYLPKVVAYQPKGNAPELDLPLLPEIVMEDDVEKLAKNSMSLCESDMGYLNTWVRGYNAATKFYSENDLRKAFNFGFNEGINYADLKNIDEEAEEISDEYWDVFVKNLKQPKTKWFVAEIEQYPINYHKDLWHNRLKTTKINGKTFLVGKYVNE